MGFEEGHLCVVVMMWESWKGLRHLHPLPPELVVEREKEDRYKIA